MSFSKLDLDGILREALGLLNEQGLDQVSLRKLAAGLGVQVSSLYWHVENRDALFGLMAETIFRSCLDAIGEAATWEQWLARFGHELWAAQISVRDAHQLILRTTLRGEVQQALNDEIVAALERLDLDREIAALAHQSVQALVTGWTALQRGPMEVQLQRFDAALTALIAGWAGEVERQDRARPPQAANPDAYGASDASL